jgi:hypothetical protein
MLHLGQLMNQPIEFLFIRRIIVKTLTALSATTALFGALAMAPLQAQASVLQFQDLNNAGAGTGSWVALDKLNTSSSPQVYQAFSNLGADRKLTNNDTFTENLNLVVNSSDLGLNDTRFDLGGDYKITAQNTGYFTNVTGGAIQINADNTVTAAADARFDVVFSSSILNLFNNRTNQLIASLTFINGGGSNIQLVAGQFIGDITLNAVINTASSPCAAPENTCDAYIRDASGNSIIDQLVYTVTTGSARFLGFDGSLYNDGRGNGLLVTTFRDNGEGNTFETPEPGSLALLGLGMFGLGALRRSKKSA